MRTLCLLFMLLQLSWSFSSAVPPPSSHLCLPYERDALLDFKNTSSISYNCGFYSFDNPRTEYWNKSNDCCSWEGVKCDELTGHVIGINLTHGCLEGPLLANNTLFHLHNLQWLDLSWNSLEGSLLENNSNLFHFRGLQRLNLANNNFDGSISSELFSHLVSLTHLDLSSNEFSALIPNEISLLSSLVSLDLSYGLPKLRFDAQGFDMLARNLTKLTNLVLDSVDMSDVALTSFINLTLSAQHLSLIDCELDGEFSSQVFQLPNLKHLDLYKNENLTGHLPQSNWGTALELLDLSDCSFRGSIPSSFGNLTQIISMHLSGNWFEGQIPDAFGNLAKLTFLTISSCNLSGPLPITMFNLPEITYLDLSHNHLEGPLPNYVGDLQFLEGFLLYHNSISGGVPSWLFTLPSLKRVELDYNKLAGPMDRIQMPSSVHYLGLCSNNFDGQILDPIFELVNLTSLDLSSNNLSGVVKSDMLSKLANLQFLDLSNNSLLSLSASGNDVNYSFPQLETVLFSGCSVRQFPNFFQTSKLEVLDLSNNMISGGISKWEAQGWEYLKMLNLSYNSLTTLEQFPGKILQVLDLHSNSLQGPILSTCLNLQILNPQKLEWFIISENKLAGSIPSSICNCSRLRLLDLSKNNLSGTIPECLGNFSFLEVMNLQMNNFYGKIPDSFVTSSMLSHLFLDDNQLEGLVPPSLANSTLLEVLNLGNNKLTDRFPHWLASLPCLQVLILRSNRFYGSLPHSIAPSNFNALRIIDLSGNEFSDSLPTELLQNLRAMTDVPKDRSSDSLFFNSARLEYEYYQISVNVTTKTLELELTKTAAIFVSMDLSNNHFSGQIPDEVGQLISLHMLNFSHNNFTGPIPASFGNLVALESLDLSSNQLGGRIPTQMTKLTFLEVLNLSKNHLVGPIPRGKQFDTFDNDSYSNNLGLCGLPLSKQCGDQRGAEPPAPLVVEHEGNNALPSFWKAAMMGYGSGVVVGVSLGYIVFKTGRPWWFVKMVEVHLQYKFTNWMRRRNRPKRN